MQKYLSISILSLLLGLVLFYPIQAQELSRTAYKWRAGTTLPSSCGDSSSAVDIFVLRGSPTDIVYICKNSAYTLLNSTSSPTLAAFTGLEVTTNYANFCTAVSSIGGTTTVLAIP